jgi:hypothetical protein
LRPSKLALHSGANRAKRTAKIGTYATFPTTVADYRFRQQTGHFRPQNGVLVTGLQKVPISKTLKLNGKLIFLLQKWLIYVRLRFSTFLAPAHCPDTDLRYRQISVKSYDSSIEKWRKCVLLRE